MKCSRLVSSFAIGAVNISLPLFNPDILSLRMATASVSSYVAWLYILYSATLDKFYIGATSDILKERIRRHLSDHKGFTAAAKDWRLVYSEQFNDFREAHKRETQIKSWKSKAMISKLIATA